MALIFGCVYWLASSILVMRYLKSYGNNVAGNSDTKSAAATATAAQSHCHPKKHVVLAKVHKTASTTIQNILLRYAKVNDLIMALPPNGMHHFNYPKMMNFAEISPASKCARHKKFDMILHHMVFKPDDIAPWVHADTVYIGILRDPAQALESYYNYFQFSSRFRINFSEFMKRPEEIYKKNPGPVLRNVQSLDLGLSSLYFDNSPEIEKFIHQLDNTFHLVMIM